MADVGDEVLPNRFELAQPRYIVKDEQRAVTRAGRVDERKSIDHDRARFADTFQPQFVVEDLRLLIELMENGGDFVPPRCFENRLTSHGRLGAKKRSGRAIGETDLSVRAYDDDTVDHPVEDGRNPLRLGLKPRFAADTLVFKTAGVAV